MPISISTLRHISTFLTKPKTLKFPPKKSNLYTTNSSFSSTSTAQFLTHLQKHQTQKTHLEKTFKTLKPSNLDSKTLTQILKTFPTDQNPNLALRFFIWAASLNPKPPSSYMFDKASKLLNFDHKLIANVMKDYKDEGFVVSVKMFKIVLSLCKSVKDANLGLWVLRKMSEFNVRPDTVSYNVVIRLLVGDNGEGGRLDEAIGLMREMGLIDLYPDMVTYVSVIKGCCDVGRLEEAFAFVKEMKGRGCVANAVVYSALLDGICMHGSLEMGLEFLSGMEKEGEGIKPNVVSYTTMIKGFVEKGRVKEGLKVLNSMDEFGIKPNRVTFVVVLDGLCKEGLVDEAREVVEKFSGDGGFCCDEMYSLLVVSLLRGGEFKEGEKVFRMMMSRGMRPNGLASSSVIQRVILEKGRGLDGFLLFDGLEKSGNLMGLNSGVCSKLLDVLCGENCFVEAAKVIDFMRDGGILLKSAHAENVIKHLEMSGEHELASSVSGIKR